MSEVAAKYVLEVREGRTGERADGEAQVVRREEVAGSGAEALDRARRLRWRERQEWAREGFVNVSGEWWKGWTWREVWIVDEEGRKVA